MIFLYFSLCDWLHFIASSFLSCVFFSSLSEELNFMNKFFHVSFLCPNKFLCFICYEFCTIFFFVWLEIKICIERAARTKGSWFEVHTNRNETWLDFCSFFFHPKIHLTKSKPQKKTFGEETLLTIRLFCTLIKSLTRWPFNFVSFLTEKTEKSENGMIIN
jgi:hypothetical protein